MPKEIGNWKWAGGGSIPGYGPTFFYEDANGNRYAAKDAAELIKQEKAAQNGAAEAEAEQAEVKTEIPDTGNITGIAGAVATLLGSGVLGAAAHLRRRR